MYIQFIPKLNQGEMNNLNRSILSNDAEVVIKKIFQTALLVSLQGITWQEVSTIKVAAFADPAS